LEKANGSLQHQYVHGINPTESKRGDLKRDALKRKMGGEHFHRPFRTAGREERYQTLRVWLLSGCRYATGGKARQIGDGLGGKVMSLAAALAIGGAIDRFANAGNFFGCHVAGGGT
jgi:hypothetical protein